MQDKNISCQRFPNLDKCLWDNCTVLASVFIIWKKTEQLKVAESSFCCSVFISFRCFGLCPMSMIFDLREWRDLLGKPRQKPCRRFRSEIISQTRRRKGRIFIRGWELFVSNYREFFTQKTNTVHFQKVFFLLSNTYVNNSQTGTHVPIIKGTPTGWSLVHWN